MIQEQNVYSVVSLNPTSLTNGATGTGGVIDTQGYDYATLLWISSTADVISNSPSVISLQTADVTAASSFAGIPAFTGGVAAGNFTIPNMPTVTNAQVYAMMNVDLRAQKRYLRPLVSPRTTQTWEIICLLSRAAAFPVGDVTPGLQNVSGIVVTG